MLTFYPSRIPDPGVKKAPNPGSGSATLIFIHSSNVSESDSLSPDLNPVAAFWPNTNPDPGFLWPKIEKIYSWKKIDIFLTKLKIAIYLLLGLQKAKRTFKHVQATGEAFSPQKRKSSTSKYEISQLFSFFMGHFCPPGSGSGSTDLIKSGSNPNPKHCKIAKFSHICMHGSLL